MAFGEKDIVEENNDNDNILSQVMHLMGLKTTSDEASQIFATVDKNRDGKITLQEFISYIGK